LFNFNYGRLYPVGKNRNVICAAGWSRSGKAQLMVLRIAEPKETPKNLIASQSVDVLIKENCLHNKLEIDFMGDKWKWSF
jgi:hypothetical protein